jgi:hypothetical protein
VKGTLRGKRLFTKDLPNAFKLVNSENAEDIAKAIAVFYEVLFLIEKALNSMELKKYVFVETEKAAAVQRFKLIEFKISVNRYKLFSV